MKLPILLLYMLSASFIDVKKRKIPIYFFLFFTFIFTACKIFVIEENFDIFAFFPGLLLLLISHISKGGLGTGDSILILTLGILLNIYEILYTILFAFFFTSIIGIFIFIKKRNKKQQLPFVPFLFLSLLLLHFI